MIPQIDPQVIQTVASEWERLKKEPFKFCVEQIDLYRENNKEFLIAVDDVISQVFIEYESDDVPQEQREINRAKAFAIVCIVLKMVGVQLEVNELYNIYGK